MDRGPLSSFAVATLHMASREGQGDDMAIRIKLPPCFGSSKRTKYELIMEAVLSRGPLWHNVHYVEHARTMARSSYHGTANPYVRSWRSAYAPPCRRLEYMPTGAGHLPPLTLVVCAPDGTTFKTWVRL